LPAWTISRSATSFCVPSSIWGLRKTNSEIKGAARTSSACFSAQWVRELCDCHVPPAFAPLRIGRACVFGYVIYYHIGMVPRLIKSDALKLLRQCLQSGIVEYHPHFEKRCRERGVDPQDAQYVLRKGIIYDEAELDIRFQ
jgi:hypothetical protein